MGERFSWDKLLRRDKGDENVPLNTEESVELNGAETVTQVAPSSKPVRIEWDSYRPIPDDIPATTPSVPVAGSAPPVAEGQTIEPYRVADVIEPTLAVEPVTLDTPAPVAPVSQPPVTHSPVAEEDEWFTSPSDIRAEEESLPQDVLDWLDGGDTPTNGGHRAVGGFQAWDDVELTPAEQAGATYAQPVEAVQHTEAVTPVEPVVEPVVTEPPVHQSFAWGTVGTEDMVAPRYEDVVPPPIPAEPVGTAPVYEDLAHEVSGYGAEPVVEPTVEPVVDEAVEAVSFGAKISDSVEPIQDDTAYSVEGLPSVPTWEPVAGPVSEAPVVSDGIPDIFKKAMGLPVGEPAPVVEATVEPEVPVAEAASSVETSGHEVSAYGPPAYEASSYEALADEPSGYEVSGYESAAEVLADEEAVGFSGAVEVPNDEPTKVYELDEAPALVDLDGQAEGLTESADLASQFVKDRRLGALLLERKLITQRQLDRALETQLVTRQKLGQILVEMQTISERRLVEVLAQQKDVEPYYFDEFVASPGLLALVPAEVCRIYHVLPVGEKDGALVLAMADVLDEEAVATVMNASGKAIERVLADEMRLAYWVDQCYLTKTQDDGEQSNLLVENALAAWQAYVASNGGRESVESEADTEPVAELVQSVLDQAVLWRASDVHIDPQDGRGEIRLRLDGQLNSVCELPGELVEPVIGRIRHLAGFDLSQPAGTEDGKAIVTSAGKEVGLRVSFLTNSHGVRVVMRVLDPTVGLMDITELGFEETNLEMFRELLTKPYGLILVTGPTGSGKTTTLYAALNELKKTATNIMTCEDPIEYDLTGISQAEVDERAGQTLNDQLRAVLRQDPDVVLVGEIRDAATAETALRAAASGHLVLSTMHCNDAASAVPRLLDMGIEPSLLSSTLVGVVSQRLVRKLCECCQEAGLPTNEERAVLEGSFELENVAQVWHTGGCDGCRDTGYAGRTAVHEVLPVTGEIASLISQKTPVEKIREEAAYYGYLPMQQDAVARVLSGQTTVEEARRVLAIETIGKRREPRRLELPKAS